MSADERSSLYLRSRSSDSLKPQMVFELFELVGVLRVRPRVSQQFSKGKQACLVFSTISSVSYGAVENEDCRLTADCFLEGLEDNGTVVVTFSFALCKQ